MEIMVGKSANTGGGWAKFEISLAESDLEGLLVANKMAGRRKELNETEAFLILETMGQILASQQFRLRHPGAWTESDQAELVGFDSMFKDVIARVQARLGPESPWTT